VRRSNKFNKDCPFYSFRGGTFPPIRLMENYDWNSHERMVFENISRYRR